MEDYHSSLAEFEERFATEALTDVRQSRQRGKLFYRIVQQSLMIDPVSENDLKAETPSKENFDDMEF